MMAPPPPRKTTQTSHPSLEKDRKISYNLCINDIAAFSALGGDNMTAIHAVGITHTYNGKDIILNGIDLDVEKGEFLSILGASGSGKTTLLSVIGGIETPTSGHVYIDGEDIAAAKEKRRAILRRTKIGFVFQFFNLAPYLNVEQNILVPVLLNGKGKKSVEKELDALLSFVGLEDKRTAMPGKLSGGEQQRVAIARGLIFHPDIILLDEPTGNLDSANSEGIMQLLKRVNSEFGTTVIQVTHNEHNAEYGSRIIRIRDGKIVDETENL